MFLLCGIKTNFIDRFGRLFVQNGRSNISTHWDTRILKGWVKKFRQKKKKKSIILHSFNNMFSVKYGNAHGLKIG